jgi:hypothetical protein
MSARRSGAMATVALTAMAIVYGACGMPLPGEGAGSGGPVERGRPLCFDGVDNDGDGLTDCDDPYCDGVCVEICTDFVDNDGDGKNGCDDPKCADQECFEPHEICWNEIDEDANGVDGCDDPACFEDPFCKKLNPEICDNGVDDNVDDQADCDDPECHLAPNCEQCDDGIDNDADGLTDCEDLPRCTIPCGLVEKCTGGVDEDQDDAIDCKDSDCSDDAACIVGCRVRQKADPLGVPTYEDTCRAGYLCTCPGAPGCPTPDPNAGQIIGDLLGTSELCEEPQTCEQGGGCRPINGVYTLRFRRASIPVDDFLNDPELYVVVNGERISGVGDDYHYYCDDCYRIINVPEVSSLHVELWDQDILNVPDSPDDIDHSDLIVTCDIALTEDTLKQRAINCRGNGTVELTIEPHVTP